MKNYLKKLKSTGFLLFFICFFVSHGMEKADLVRVEKSLRKMYLLKESGIIKVYDISLGKNPVGPKEMYGDQKTPEGVYTLDYKNDKSTYYKSIHISYPDERDRKNAAKKGWNPGGDITIHGQLGNDVLEGDWTEGCIAVSNEDIDEIWELIDIPTTIIIEP
jgi:murein L,D-transpeptidase YafK